MPWLPLYLVEEDITLLNDWINQEDELAFLIRAGHREWKAVKEHSIVSDIQNLPSGLQFLYPDTVEYQLWHIPTGPLPLLQPIGREDIIENPWLGWRQERTGANSNLPYFGAGYCGVFHLQIILPRANTIALSSFQWIGNHYQKADASTEHLWKKIRGMAKKTGKKIPRENNLSRKSEIYAFPKAYAQIRSGRPCSLN